MDPADVLDISIVITQGDAAAVPPPFLLTGEAVGSFTLTLSAEAVAAGLAIKQANGYPAPTFSGLICTFWLAVDAAMQTSPIFDGEGVTLSLELTVVTTSDPKRTKQRTLTVKVANQ